MLYVGSTPKNATPTERIGKDVLKVIRIPSRPNASNQLVPGLVPYFTCHPNDPEIKGDHLLGPLRNMDQHGKTKRSKVDSLWALSRALAVIPRSDQRGLVLVAWPLQKASRTRGLEYEYE